MNNATVEFHDFDGEKSLTLPDAVLPNDDGETGPLNYTKPSIVTMLIDSSLLVADDNGVHKYTWEPEPNTFRFVKSMRPTLGNIYGMVVVREEQGGILFVVQDDPFSLVRFRIYDLNLEVKKKDRPVAFPLSEDGQNIRSTIRFAAGVGNTVALSDMNKLNQGIWICDTEGVVRRKIGAKQSDEDGEFIQAAGICFDSEGNFLAICSKSSRVQLFDNEGNYLSCLQFPEGAIQRPSDLSINEDGDLAVVSLTGQCFLFRLRAGDPNNNFVTRGPKPVHERGYNVIGRHGRSNRYHNQVNRGRGRGNRGRGRGRGNGRGRGRGENLPVQLRY